MTMPDAASTAHTIGVNGISMTSYGMKLSGARVTKAPLSARTKNENSTAVFLAESGKNIFDHMEHQFSFLLEIIMPHILWSFLHALISSNFRVMTYLSNLETLVMKILNCNVL